MDVRRYMLSTNKLGVGLASGLAILSAITVLLIRIWMLAKYSSSMPFWDAWAAESAPLYTPWIQDEFQWSNLWAWHNEHRIFFTRVLDVGIFIANELQWDVRVQTLASSAIFACMCGISVYWILRNTPTSMSLALVVATIIAVNLPCGWANTYHGFQSCFYFVLLFALLTIHSAASANLSLTRGLLLALLGLSAVFSLGAGVLVTFAAVVVVAARAWFERASWSRLLVFGLPLLVVAVWAVLDARKGDAHPATVVELVRAFAIMMSWPFFSVAGMVLWIPALCVLVHVVRRRTATTADLVFGGLSVWVLLICAAVAWSRSAYSADVQSRYTDLLIPSFVAQIYFAFRLASLVRSQYRSAALAHVGAIILALASISGLSYVSMIELWKWRENDFFSILGASHVRAYLDGDTNALNGYPHGYIPFPEAAPLAAILDDAVVRSYLPISIASLKTPVAQRSRSCVWSTSKDVSSTDRGEVSCVKLDRPINPAAELSVGRLSAVTYWIWEMIGRQRYETLTFDSSPESTLATAQCAIEQVNGLPVVSSSVSLAYADVIRMIGWLGPQPVGSSRPALEVMLVDGVGHRYSGKFEGGWQRLDVASAMARTGYDMSGFNVVVDGSAMPPGEYSVQLANAEGMRCNSRLTVNIVNGTDVRLRY